MHQNSSASVSKNWLSTKKKTKKILYSNLITFANDSHTAMNLIRWNYIRDKY